MLFDELTYLTQIEHENEFLPKAAKFEFENFIELFKKLNA